MFKPELLEDVMIGSVDKLEGTIGKVSEEEGKGGSD